MEISKTKEATIAALALVAVWGISKFLPISTDQFYMISVPVRIATCIWVYNICKKYNRATTGLSVLAFLFPTLSLFIAGQFKRVKS